MIPIILTSAAYIAAQILADIGSLRIIFLFGFSMDGGTLIYPFTFTLRDMVHKAAGVHAARALIIAAAAINLLMACYFWLISVLPADPSVTQANFSAVLTPVWRIVFASILAEIISEFLDTEIYHLWVTHFTQRFQWTRVLTSNAISIPIDSLIFTWAAFGGWLATEVVWSIFLSNLLVKGATTLIGMPLIYLVKDETQKP